MPAESPTLAVSPAAPATAPAAADMGSMPMPMPMHEHGTATTLPVTTQALYTCPMHPEVVSDRPGNCPKCGMKLVKSERTGRLPANIERNRRPLASGEGQP